MQQDRSRGREVGHRAGARAKLLRAALAVALAGLVVSLDASVLRAADADDDASNESAWNKVMQRLGLKKPAGADSEIDYTERAPLVVPPSRDLPPPAASVPVQTADWPQDSKKPRKHAKGKAAIIPDTAVQTPNPPVEKKPWYNPLGWFDKEEYANFNGEPVRQNLTDPPAGYRIPSPSQPYGLSPDKKAAKKVGGDGTAIQTGSQTPTQNPPPPAAQPPAATSQPGPPTVLQPEAQAGR
jgi:hypothetical protein